MTPRFPLAGLPSEGDLVVLDAPQNALAARYRLNGARHQVVAIWVDEYLGPMAELRLVDAVPDAPKNNLSWPIAQIRVISAPIAIAS